MSCYLMSSHNCKRFAAGLVFYNCTATEADYAKQPSANPRYPDVDNEKALKAYILYRVFQDLKRGWKMHPRRRSCTLP